MDYYKDTLMMGLNRETYDQSQRIEELTVENHKLKIQNEELMERLNIWKNHLHAISADDLIRFSQDIKYDEIKNREKKVIDSIIKPDAMMDLVKNLKRELNFERERNFELE